MVVFLERFYPERKLQKAELAKEDEWMMSRLNSTMKEFRSSFDSYEINRAAKSLRSFIVDDVSRFYMKIAKDRISSADRAEGALWTIYTVMLESLKMLGCFSPMLSEHLYQRFFKRFEDAESVSLLRFPQPDESKINVLYEKQMETVKELLSVALLARQTAGIKVRWPVGVIYIETKSHEIGDAVNSFGGILLDLVNVKEIKLVAAKPEGDTAAQVFSQGTLHLDKKIDEALYEEGVLNEVKRRFQMMRKEAELVESDRISISIDAEKELEGIIKKHEKSLCEAVNASALAYSVEKEMKEYTIDGRLVKLALKKG
jgi:isoleucyl-tRNA synthetase